MRYMEHIDGILSLIDREFADMEQNGKFRSKDDIELVYKMMDIVKDAAEYCEKMGEMDYGYSEYNRPDSMRLGRYPYDGNSYARGGMRGYNYNDGYGMRQSRTDPKEDYLNRLRAEANNAPDDRTREHLLRMIHDMEQ